MRMLIAAMGLLATTGIAEAQGVAGRGHAMNPGMHGMNRAHWGGRIQGRWWGGWRAPGGWGAYRAPVRGRVLPRYWIAPQFSVVDWRGYGLPQPPAGYRWSRYYDDAVLIDDRGSIYDRMGGVDWDRYDGPGTDYAYDEPGYDEPGDDGPDHDGRVPPPPRGRDNGVGGAIIGGVAGGLAGNAIAGHGDKLGGTIVGAGAGALVGAAIGRAGDRRGPPPPPPPPPYGAGYDVPPPHGRHDRGPPPPLPPLDYYGDAAGPIVTSSGAGRVHSETHVTGGDYFAGGYYYPPATVTTITIDNPDCGEATHTEYVTERVVRRPAVRRAAPTKLLRRAPSKALRR